MGSIGAATVMCCPAIVAGIDCVVFCMQDAGILRLMWLILYQRWQPGIGYLLITNVRLTNFLTNYK